jgi:hypothetical protein
VSREHRRSFCAADLSASSLSRWFYCAALPAALGALHPATIPSLRAAIATSELRIDGRLDEPAWTGVDSIADLTQIEPNENTSPSGRTVVRAIVTRDALIFGIRCYYPPGTPVVTFARERDAPLENEDHVRIVLDTFRDGRSGYVFAVNPNGARYDALVSDNGEGENSNWDAAWEAATVRSATGWTAEIRIPVKSVLFNPGLTGWGFNIQRRMQARQETDRWSNPSRDIKITQTSGAGLLSNLPRFDLGLGMSVRPSVVGGAGHDSAAGRFRNRSHVSLDLTKRFGANTIGSATVNTDFAETEADTRRVNLTRFPLFFPEKRSFFLEGADIFDFGLGLDEDVVPFFSRRIGLIEGEQVPINVGAKVNGRIGGINFGALGVETRDIDTLRSASTMGVMRLTQNVLGESSVGIIATAGDPLRRAGSWLAGPDLTFRTSRFRGDKNFLVGVWGLATRRADLRGDRSAAGFKIDYPNDLWDIALRYKRIGDGFDPSLGFVPRAGVHIASLSVEWQPRPKRPIGPLHVRQCFWENELSYVAGLIGGWQSYSYFMAPINCRLESGDRFEFNIVPTGERLAEAFDISEGVTIPAGAHHFRRFRLEGELANKRRFNAQATWWFGSFYNGYLNQYELTSAWKPSSLFIVELNGERDVGHMPTGHFVQNLLGTRMRLNFSPDLQLTSLLQLDDESHSFGTNTRLRWTFDPLGDVFVVYNHNLRTRDPLTLERQLAFESNQLLLKVQYAFRY